MKPLKLTMSAFGSYADIQKIDFTKLGTNGLYLITGETGSGKTTIFDAISFALFGKASGSGRNEYQMLRSDFANVKTKTYVELEFLCKNNHYYIKRSIKKTGQEAELRLPDGTNITKRKDIDGKIIEVIGLDREQFVQIVMIAQNDFMRFLQSGTDNRIKILRRIFMTETLKEFQERLKFYAKSESDKLSLIIHDFDRYNVEIHKRNEQFALWKSQITTHNTDIIKTEKKISEYDNKKRELAAALAVATELSKKFSELAACRSQFVKHIASANEITLLKEHTIIGEIAFHKVKPLADAQTKAITDHKSAILALSNAQEQLSVATINLEAAKKIMSELPNLENEQRNFNSLVKEWEISSDKLEKLKILQSHRQDILRKQKTFFNLQKQLDAVLKEIREFPSIEEKRIELDELTSKLTGEIERHTKLVALRDDLKELENKQNELELSWSKFENLNADFIDADKKYQELEEKFLRSQAGIFASSLVDGEACPVCGSKDHPAPAAFSSSNLTEATLKKKRDHRDNLRTEREKKSSECNILKNNVNFLNQNFIKNLSSLNINASTDSKKTCLFEAIKKTKINVDALSIKKANAEKLLKNLKEKKAKAEKIHGETAPQCTALNSEIKTLTNRFLSDFSNFLLEPQWEESEFALFELVSTSQKQNDEMTTRKIKEEKKLSAIKNQWKISNDRMSNAQKAFTVAKALIEERTTIEQRLLRDKNAVIIDFENALKKSDFITEKDYYDALISEDEINKNKKRISDYEKKEEQFARDIKRLENEIENKEKPNLEKLIEEDNAVNIQAKELSNKRDTIKKDLDKITNALKELRDRAIEFEKVEKKYAAVRQLADTANGKLDFETYAQMAYFEQVLRAANLRLKLMSQNRYTLLRKGEGGDGRKRAGLEIEVLDSYTGKARSANSLSGGESFMASLSLALGLSDVVQQNSGGVHLEAMFIDEGFGSLDADGLELAVKTLSKMAKVGRIIGIISHVAELREQIDKQIQIEKTFTGSKLTLPPRLKAGNS